MENQSLQLLSTRTAADLLGVHVVTLRGWAREGRVPCVRIGGRWKFRVSDLKEWIDEKAGEGQAKLPGTR